MSKSQLQFAFIGIILAICGLIALFLSTSKNTFGEKQPSSFAELGGDFTLQSVKGDVSLSDFKGKAVVMYFGFMSCPEVCPNSMGVIQGALNKLESEKSDQVQGIMISIDPERDSLTQLADFTRYFHPNIIGITGEPSELEQVAKQYGAYFAKTPDERREYVFEHVSRYYVINKQGQLVDAMRHSTTANELAARLKTVI